MKNLMSALVVLALTPSAAFSAPSTPADLVGKYKLQQIVFGHCYPEIEAVEEDFLGNKGFGIYGAPGSGEIVFQFQFLNRGYHSVPQTNPMTGETIGLMNTLSVIGDGRLQGSTEVTDARGRVTYRHEIKGSFGDGTLQFEASEQRAGTPVDNGKSACVYQKVN